MIALILLSVILLWSGSAFSVNDTTTSFFSMDWSAGNDFPMDDYHPSLGYAFDPPPDSSLNRSPVRESLTIEQSLMRLERFFGKRIERRLPALPVERHVGMIPWPGDYWPVYTGQFH